MYKPHALINPSFSGFTEAVSGAVFLPKKSDSLYTCSRQQLGLKECVSVTLNYTLPLFSSERPLFINRTLFVVSSVAHFFLSSEIAFAGDYRGKKFLT